jgi:hypothetical protein
MSSTICARTLLPIIPSINDVSGWRHSLGCTDRYVRSSRPAPTPARAHFGLVKTVISAGGNSVRTGSFLHSHKAERMPPVGSASGSVKTGFSLLVTHVPGGPLASAGSGSQSYCLYNLSVHVTPFGTCAFATADEGGFCGPSSPLTYLHSLAVKVIISSWPLFSLLSSHFMKGHILT